MRTVIIISGQNEKVCENYVKSAYPERKFNELKQIESFKELGDDIMINITHETLIYYIPSHETLRKVLMEIKASILNTKKQFSNSSINPSDIIFGAYKFIYVREYILKFTGLETDRFLSFLDNQVNNSIDNLKKQIEEEQAEML